MELTISRYEVGVQSTGLESILRIQSGSRIGSRTLELGMVYITWALATKSI